MKNICLCFCLLICVVCTPAFAQCPISVNAGEDIFICNPPQDAQLNGEINGDYIDFYWSPSADFAQPDALSPILTVGQSKTFILTAAAWGENLIVNGDFEQGNTGFTSQFNYSQNNLVPMVTYDVLPNPQAANDAFNPCVDHTYGSGNMLAANSGQSSLYVWRQTVAVTPNTDYKFSFWATTLMGVPRPIRIRINAFPIPQSADWMVPAGCEWGQYEMFFNSGVNSSLDIEIRTIKAHITIPFSGFAIDDISLQPKCEVKDTVKVNVVDITANASPGFYTISCAGNNVTLHGTGSSVGPNFTYNWETQDGNIVSGHNTLHPVANAPGTYTLTVSVENGIGDCSESVHVIVTENNPLQASISAPQSLNCTQNTPLTAQSNLPPTAFASYQWTAGPGGNIVSGANTATALIDKPGSYSLTITNTATSCTAEANVVVAAPILPAAVATATPITCSSQPSTLSGAGSANGPNFTYAWSTPNGNIASGQDSLYATADTQGIYVLVVTNTLSNCSAADTVTVTVVNALPEVNILPADNITCVQNNITLETDSATAGAHFIYAWTASAGGNIVSGADSLAPVVNAPGLYILSVTDTLSACTGTDSVWVAADTDAVIAIAGANGSITCVNNSVTLNADGSSMDPSLIYQWSTSNGNIVSGAGSPNPTVDAPGEYQLLLTNPANGCSASDMVEVTQNTALPEVSLLPHASLSCALPLLVLQGQNAAPQGNFSYTWTAENGGHIVAGDSTLTLCVDAAGTYTLHVTDLDNGCTATTATDVSADFNAPDAALTVSGVLNCHNPAVNLLNSGSGDPALLNHEWTTPDGSVVNTGADPSLDAQLPGNYALLISNTQNGCTATAAATVVQHEPVTVTPTAQADASCFGAADGAAAVVAAGGDGSYSFLWSNGETTPAVANLPAGIYSVTATDDENCTATATVIITQPDPLMANASTTPPSVIGAADGTATANPQGGTAPYTFLWNNGAASSTITGLAAGFYTVTVTDANGCTAVQTVEVWGGECFLLADLQTVDPLCSGLANGQATALPNGGAEPYSYLWSSGSTEQTAINLAAGTYSVTVTDTNGCPFAGTVTLEDPALLTLVVDNTVHAACPNSTEGAATVIAGGGTGSVDILWSNGQSGPTASGLSTGNYTATATDANGCTATATATIQAIDQEPPMITAGATTLALGPSGSVELMLQNLGATVTDNCGVAEVFIVPQGFDCTQLGEQQVTITATDDAGNSATQTLTVTVLDTEVPVLNCPGDITRCVGDNTVEYPAPVAVDNCLILGGTFELVNGLPSGSPFPQGTTTNTYTYADVSGNMGSCSFQVTVLSPLDIQLDALVHDINNQHIGSIQVTVGGSMPDYTYEWTLDGAVVATTEDLSGIGMGLYTQWVTDAAGCKKEAGPFEVTSLVETDDPDLTDRIALYPNPTSGVVFAILPDELVNSDVHFTVFDHTGRKMLEQNSSQGKRVTINLSGMASGLYSIVVRSEQGYGMHKIVTGR